VRAVIRSRRLITIRRGEREYIVTAKDMALFIYLILSVLVLVFGFILLFLGNVNGAQVLFTFFGGMGISEVLHRIKEWEQEPEEAENG
jgi:hypothetical protein